MVSPETVPVLDTVTAAASGGVTDELSITAAPAAAGMKLESSIRDSLFVMPTLSA